MPDASVLYRVAYGMVAVAEALPRLGRQAQTPDEEPAPTKLALKRVAMAAIVVELPQTPL
jgi:hypothetical protein